MRQVAESFAWPFRGRSRSAWAWGLVCVLFLPLLFVPLFGYAIAATRAAQDDAALGPPPWRWSLRLLVDGFWTALVVLATLLPFALVLNPLAGALRDQVRGEPYAHVVALFLLALVWGLAALLLLPHAAASFAATGRLRDLVDVGSALRGVRRDFVTWNAAAAAIVSGWALGLACAGLFCVGLVPGAFYAILVSAHAAAALQPQSSPQGPPAR